ncbi:MAG: DUF488 domain-containing protein [Pirellulales bacterium]|nr:DUF488 domain-containing protein [Pirellulales bacterium]
MSSERPTICTIGHSTHALDEFLALLDRHGITAVADVRWQPYGWQEHFNRENLAAALKSAEIEYVFLGQQLGARREERECYENGVAVYARIAKLPAFQEGLARLRRGAEKYRLAILCAEKEPLDCHRTILVCRHLRQSGLPIRHILADGPLEDHDQTEKRLVRQMGVTRTLFEPDLTDDGLLDRAYDERGAQTAYRAEQEGGESEGELP